MQTHYEFYNEFVKVIDVMGITQKVEFGNLIIKRLNEDRFQAVIPFRLVFKFKIHLPYIEYYETIKDNIELIEDEINNSGGLEQFNAKILIGRLSE